MNKTKLKKPQALFAKAISLLLVFSVLSFGYQPTCSSMQNITEPQKTPQTMLADHSCCVQGSNDQSSQLNSSTTQIEISKFACQCKSQVLSQFQFNPEIQLISNQKTVFTPLSFAPRNNTIILSSVYKAIPKRTAPPQKQAAIQTLEKILI